MQLAIKKLNVEFIGAFALVFAGPGGGGHQNKELCRQRLLRNPIKS